MTIFTTECLLYSQLPNTRACVHQQLNPSFITPFAIGTHTLYQGGRGSVRPPAISKTIALMDLKFCRILETPFNVLEILKLFT